MQKNGLSKSDIEAVPNDTTNAKKLEAGKILGWYTGCNWWNSCVEG